MPSPADVKAWRKGERERLIAARLAIPAERRAAMAADISRQLDSLLGEAKGRTISLYWPFRGEPDLRPWMAALNARGATTALPVVVAPGRPLVFRSYAPGDALEKGVWNIPVPRDGPEVLPDIVIAPVVGVDGSSYRLGYGGGFFDRTLAAMSRKPLAIGIGYETQRIETIHPQWHDIPMDAVVMA
jgi:5,10-methenyltetrahydrofolate synthetase